MNRFFWPWQIITINKWANVNTLLLLLLLLCINVPFRKIHFHLFIVGPHLNRNDKKKGQNRQSILIFLSSHNCKRFWVGSFHDPVHLRLVSKLQTSSNFCLFTKLFLNHKKLVWWQLFFQFKPQMKRNEKTEPSMGLYLSCKSTTAFSFLIDS